MSAPDRAPLGSYQDAVYWRARTPALPVPACDLPDEVDIAIVGAGLTGLAAAREAARAGASVAVFERGRLGEGASSRNAGMCHPGYSVGPSRLMQRYGEARGRAIYQDSEDAYDLVRSIVADEDIDAEVVEAGQLGLAFAPAHVAGLAAEHDELADMGVASRVIARSDLPGELDSDRYFGGLLVDRCLGLNPAGLVNGLAGATLRSGAVIHEETPVVSLAHAADGRIVVTTPRGPVAAAEVIVATSGHTDGLVRWLRRRVVSLASYVIVTDPLDENLALRLAPNGRMFYDTKNFLYYWRLTPDRRLLFGGRASFLPTSLRRTAEILYRGMTEVYPSVAGVRVAYAWSGRVDFTYDRMPHVGRHDGITYALGYCGSGVALSVFLGTKVGGWLCGEPAPNLAQIGFPVVPAPYEGRAWFLPLVGEWYRLKDRLAARSNGQVE